MPTMKEICEYIAERINETNEGEPVTAKQIYHMSPSGELGEIFILYNYYKEHPLISE